MAKFQKSRISGFDKATAESVNLGNGLLNNVSQSQAMELMTIEYICVKFIRPNKRNEMSMNDIEELAEQIKMAGLQQPLIVKKVSETEYILITGHRRFAAIMLLIERGEWPDDTVPCIIKDPDKIDLPLSSEQKEDLSIITSNKHRNKTDADLLFESRKWHEIYAALRAAGVTEFKLGNDSAGNEIYQTISGVTTRKLVSEALGESEGKVAQIKRVDDKGSQKVKDAIENKRLSLASADTMIDLPKAEQEALIDTILEKKQDGQITTADIEVYRNKKKNNTSTISTKSAKVEMDLKQFQAETKEIRDLLKDNTIMLEAEDYAKCMKYINQIHRILKLGR